VFQEHPDWFMKDENGRPLPSNEVGFGGWRLGPWYALDGTHPEAQAHLENVVRTMRVEWGCTYFKLDANYWGALHKGKLHDPKATRIEAYRRGMEAVLRGAENAFVLGCNHPVWASLGLIDGSRSSNDVSRKWSAVTEAARQNLLRGWQNGTLWWNDPDCAVLSGGGLVLNLSGETTGRTGLPANEAIFHAASIHATGGMMLSGDDLTQLTADRVELMQKLIPPTATAARFENASLDIGRADLDDQTIFYLFNWTDTPVDRTISLSTPSKLKDYLTGEELGRHEGVYRVTGLPGRSARVLVATRA
jgi:alpha-galactosidase